MKLPTPAQRAYTNVRNYGHRLSEILRSADAEAVRKCVFIYLLRCSCAVKLTALRREASPLFKVLIYAISAVLKIL
jgi:hypothetical protein